MKGDGKRNNKKCLAYVAAFVVFQTIIIVVFALTVMRIKSPKVRFGTVSVENKPSTTNSSAFDMKLVAQVTIKNTNFGHFKYDSSNVTILYGGVPVGNAVIPEGRTKARKTQRFDVTVDISSDNLSAGNSNLTSDIGSGFLMLTSEAKLSGKVQLMKVIKKKKAGEMSCAMTVDLGQSAVKDLKCK